MYVVSLWIMYSVFWILAIIFAFAAVFSILAPTSNVSMAYNCSNSASIHAGGSSSSVSGNSGSCAKSSSSSSVAPGVGLGGSSGGHPPNKSDTAFPPGNHPKPGQTVTVSGGGSQSSCEAQSADHNSAGNRGFDYEEGSCSAHSP